nr:EOG090X03SX [Artemia franciscana]
MPSLAPSDLLEALEEVSNLFNENTINERRHLRGKLEKASLDVQKQLLESLENVVDAVDDVYIDVKTLHDSCVSLKEQLYSVKASSKPFFIQAQKLKVERVDVHHRYIIGQDVGQALIWLVTSQLILANMRSDEQIDRTRNGKKMDGYGGITTILMLFFMQIDSKDSMCHPSNPLPEMMGVFNVFKDVQNNHYGVVPPMFVKTFISRALDKLMSIQKSCEMLAAEGYEKLSRETYDSMETLKEQALDRIFKWCQLQVRVADVNNIHPLLRRSLKYLEVRPTYIEHLFEEYSSARQSVVLRQFQEALAKAEDLMEDPPRYLGDVLAWIHQASLSEVDALNIVLKLDGNSAMSEKLAWNAILNFLNRARKAGNKSDEISREACEFFTKDDIIKAKEILWSSAHYTNRVSIKKSAEDNINEMLKVLELCEQRNVELPVFVIVEPDEVPICPEIENTARLVLRFRTKTDEQAFDSADRNALAKALSLYGIPDKYIKVISAMYENNTADVKLGNEILPKACSFLVAMDNFCSSCLLRIGEQLNLYGSQISSFLRVPPSDLSAPPEYMLFLSSFSSVLWSLSASEQVPDDELRKISYSAIEPILSIVSEPFEALSRMDDAIYSINLLEPLLKKTVLYGSLEEKTRSLEAQITRHIATVSAVYTTELLQVFGLAGFLPALSSPDSNEKRFDKSSLTQLSERLVDASIFSGSPEITNLKLLPPSKKEVIKTSVNAVSSIYLQLYEAVKSSETLKITPEKFSELLLSVIP